jgi:hypothetical protein
MRENDSPIVAALDNYRLLHPEDSGLADQALTDLDALVQAVDRLDEDGTPTEDWEAIMAAVRRAKGESA